MRMLRIYCLGRKKCSYLSDNFCKVNPSNVAEYVDDRLGVKGFPI